MQACNLNSYNPTRVMPLDRGTTPSRVSRLTILHRMRRIAAMSLLPALLALGGCMTVPTPLQGAFSTLPPSAATDRDLTGENIRWGGTLLRTDPQPGQTCFEIVGRTLGSFARPVDTDRSQGRFIACRKGFYEPAVFAPGRQVTVTGRVTGVVSRPVGSYDYRQPRVEADVIYLWPERREMDDLRYRRDPFYSPFYSPFYYPSPYWWRGW